MKSDDGHSQKHLHFGRSSRELLDPAEVLSKIGLKRGEIFLDAGCGDGFMSLAASKILGNQGKIYALDIYEEAILNFKKELTRKNIKNVDAFVADLTKNTQLEAESVDVCLLANILHGFVANGEVGRALRELLRVLKTGATLAVVDFKKIPDSPGPPLEIKLNPDEVIKILAPYGFMEGKVVEVGPYHYAVTFIKKG